MKKFFALLMLALAMSACTSKHNLVVSYRGLTNDTVFLSTTPLSEFLTNPGMEEIDTLILDNGKLMLDLDVQEPLFFCIYSMDYRHQEHGRRWLRPSGEILNILYPDQPLHINALSADGYISTTVKVGNQVNKDISQVKSEFRKYQKDYEDVLWYTNDEQMTPQQRDARKMELKELLSTAHSNFIEGHPASKSSAFFLYYLKDMAEYANVVDESIFEGEFEPVRAQMERAVIVERAKQVFALEPDGMTMKTLGGEEVTAQTIAGKKVILYFWGTKQGGWLKGVPKLIEMTHQFNDKVEVVIVNCHGTDPALWQKELKAKGLKWDALFTKHAGNHYPTKVILSPAGEVLGTFVNQTSDYNKMFVFELENMLK